LSFSKSSSSEEENSLGLPRKIKSVYNNFYDEIKAYHTPPRKVARRSFVFMRKSIDD